MAEGGVEEKTKLFNTFLYMGKRNVLVISSSDEDRDVRFRSRNSSRSNSLPSKPPKRPRQLSNPPNQPLGSFDALCDDFSHDFQDFRKVAGSGKKDKSQLWVDKYRPQSLADLAVQKKKVEEVKSWLKEQLTTSKEKPFKHALVITGQAGVGKSATIHVVASHFGARLCEWDTPTPTLWQEHLHNLSSGVQYMSKLDEFESFVERIRKYPLLPMSSTGGSAPTVLLIDDLPLTNGRHAFSRLRDCLLALVGSIHIPTVILLTEYGKADSRNNATCNWEDLQSSLESAGACKMSFNPITVNSIKKTLSRICREEGHSVTIDQIGEIARVSGGDIRHAVTSLQYFCVAPDQLLSSITIHSKGKADEVKMLDGGIVLSFGRDETLSLFHALGKFLHNKRETVHDSGFEHDDVFSVSEKFARLPLKMDAPEEIMVQANVQARPIAEFLHENVLDFLSDEAIDDAWTVASYLCDADNLATYHWSTLARISNNYELESIPQLVVASVAARGVLFGNSHPTQSRWHAIRSPKLWQVEQLSRCTKNEMIRHRYDTFSGMISRDLFVMSTEYKPLLQWLGRGALESSPVELQSISMDEDTLDGVMDVSQTKDDEIEDW